MRKRFEIQYELGAVPVDQVEIPTRSRDEMPAVLRALQFLFKTPALNEAVFEILEQKIISGKKRTGRLGMTLWEILVFAVIRLARDMDFDQLHYVSETDMLLRALLGVNKFGTTDKHYSLQALKDNVSLLDEATIREINALVAKAGHQLLESNDDLDVNIDTYVLESNVHFPTDLNLLFDASRKCIQLAQKLCRGTSITGWRKFRNWINRLKSSYRKVSKLSAAGGKNKEQRLREAACDYLSLAKEVRQKLEASHEELTHLAQTSPRNHTRFKELRYFFAQLERHIDLVQRRLIYKETIPHQGKVFSLFEPYTEWIKKGKAGNRPELGLPIAVAKDQHGFVLDHHVMQKELDKDIAVPMAEKLLRNFRINSLSFDKNFWSPHNYRTLKPQVSTLVLPKKGKSNQEEFEREHSKSFVALRRQHSSVESAINSLEHHGLNRCPDKGLSHFKTYAALGILSYNLHRLGNILLAQDRNEISKNKTWRRAA